MLWAWLFPSMQRRLFWTLDENWLMFALLLRLSDALYVYTEVVPSCRAKWFQSFRAEYVRFTAFFMASLTPVHQLKGSEPQPAHSALTSRIVGVPLSTFWPFLPGSPRGLAFPDCAFRSIPAYAIALSRAEPCLVVVCNLVLSVPHTRPHSSEPGLGAFRGMKALKRHPELSNGLRTESLLPSHSFSKASQNTSCICQAGIRGGDER